MANPILIKSYVAEAAVTKYRIVKFGAADGKVLHAAAVGDAMFGVTGSLGAAIDERVDITEAGEAEVEYGGAVVRGDWLTSDANGKAVAAAPAAGINNSVIGRAKVSGASGDIGTVLMAPGRIQG